MAKSITSFKLNEKGLHFFYLHNTFFELPHTIPMDIVSFLNFNRGNFDDFLRIFHDVYPDLIIKGTTLKDSSYELLDLDVRQHTEQLAAIIERNLSKQLLDTSVQICSLFETKRTFSSFKKEFNKIFKNISPHLPRPFEYYESWNSTANALFKSNLNSHDYLQNLLKAEYDAQGNTIVPDVLFELIHKNLIPLNSIPHVYRHHPKIEEVFSSYAAVHLLPQTYCDDVKINEEFTWISHPMERAILRRFTELCLHSDYGIADNIRIQLDELQVPIHELNDEQLFELNDLSYKGARLINYSNAHGLNKLPWKYIRIEKSDELCFLAEHHDNALILIDAKSGLELNDEIYHDVLRASGSLFEANISGYYTDNHIWRYNKINNRVEYVQQSASTSNHIDSNHASFALVDSGDSYYYNSGWFNYKNEPVSPLCFTSAGNYSEGLAPVCLNGKWGFIDAEFNLVIPAIYGHVHVFNSGYAKVFQLDKDFSIEKGEWVEIPINEDLGEKFHLDKTSVELHSKFKGYPNTIKAPVRVLCDKAFQKNRIELNYFGSNKGEGLDRTMGKYVIIDKEGKVVFSNVDRFTFDLSSDGEILFKNKELIEKKNSKTPSFKRKSSSEQRVSIENEIEEYRSKLQNQECKIYDLPDELLANDEFMYDVFYEGYLNYADLPLHLKLERKFVLVELNRNNHCEQILPASVREKHLSEYRSIAAQQRIDAFVAHLSAFVLVGIDWPERIQYLELHTGKQDEMYHYTLQAVNPLTIVEVLQEIGKASIQLRAENRLFQDMFYTCENVYHKLADSEMLIVPEFTTCNITKSLTNTGISVLGNSEGVFKLQITHELGQDEYEHVIFHQANAQGDFIENCEYFITNNPPHAEERVSEYNDRIKCFLLELGYTEQAILDVPIYKETILPILDPINQLPKAPAPSQYMGESYTSSDEDDLPF
jgi:hypothetical protein